MIQLKLEFSLEKPELPRELERLTVSFIKASLQNYSQELYESLYDKSRSIIKTYTFSYFLPGAKFKKEKILLDEKNFTIFFSDADLGETIHFFNAFKQMKFQAYPMNQNSMKLTAVVSQNRKEIEDSEIIIKMLSPLIARRHNSEDNTDVYYTYSDEGFGQALKENVEVFLEKLNIPLSAESFCITPVKGKKVVVDSFGRKIDGNIGIYKLNGHPELLNLLYQAGLGVRRSEGKGKFDIIW
ncbi:CRISPR-associated endoribonuclease Cas6 [Faecalicatena contorta]|uniref:CRISPR-associated endoribonuclease Cas6 n=1 Tax=Faecalicatena contorta TaxID=39482 RepID=UPI001F343E90|nr:CRISPR-associated endoribonuclease Cas6 [Faecalicatena contorta]MCF2679644.1 CRISPR-associated endoribonuclease Cas6 [Faecalicatena contorta]